MKTREDWISVWLESEKQMEYIQTAWHYITPQGDKGTLVGSDVRTEQEAREWIARQHRCKPDEVKLRKAGED